MTTAITAVTAATTTAAATTVFQPKKEEYSVTDIFLELLKSKPRDIIKAFGYSTFWAGQAIPDLHPNVQHFSFYMGDVKNLLGAIEVPDKANTLWISLKGLWTDVTGLAAGNADATLCKVGAAARKAIKDTASLTNSVCDGIDFSTKYIQIEADVMRWIKGIGFTATLSGAVVGAGEQVQNLTKVQSAMDKEAILYMINLAREVSYVALGAIGLYFVISATPMVPWMILACLTSALSFTIGGFFYERIVDPENKGKNLNPAIVVENVVAQRNRPV